MKAQIRTRLRLLVLTAGAVCLQACGSDNNNNRNDEPPTAMASFDVTVSNLTNAQPLSPVAVIGHQSSYAVFSVGDAATVGLEQMAEGGDNTTLLAEATTNPAVLASVSGSGAIGPAVSETVTIAVPESDIAGLRISVGSMLVNTNDGFAALNAASVGSMAVGDVQTVYSIAYDAGTESDTEAASSIPGPAAGGEGFNAARDDDADRVAMHPGIVSQDDGFPTSDLTEQHRFDNPVMQIQITRTL